MTGARILVVDDNRDMANGIAMLLGEAELSAEVHVAYSAKRALTFLEAREYDLVLSDIRMPGMSGVDLLTSIRSRWPRTKVVLLTAYGTVDSAVGAMKLGAGDYLTKPFDNDALVDVVRRTLAAGIASGGFDLAAVVGEVAGAVSRPEDLLPSLRSALDVLLRATGADDGEIFLCEAEGRDPILCAWAGPDGAAMVDRDRFTMGIGYPGIVVATGKPLCTKGGLADDPRYVRRVVTDAGIRSLVAAPLPDVRAPLGSIHLMSRRSDFPVDRVLDLLEHAAIPISNSVRAGLAALRQTVDEVCGNLDDPSRQPLRVLLESFRQVAGARCGTLALIDPRTGRPDRVVSTGPASLVCGQAEAGSWATCPSVLAAHGFVANPGRRQWPESCRRGLPRRAASPCCLPLVAGSFLYGIVVLDFGREGTAGATGQLVPLLTMAHQAAIRLQSQRGGLGADQARDSGGVSLASRAELELRCLGPFAVYLRGQPIAADAFTRSKALLLLKLLAMKRGAPVHREVLLEQLWPGVAPETGANRLHGVVHDLRSVIEPRRTEREWLYVRNRGDFYYFDLNAPVEIDVARFRQLATRGLRSSPGQEADLEEALELYRGDLFEDDPFAEWCAAEREDLREWYVKVVERLTQLYAKAGRKEEALTCLRRALRSSPFRDDLVLAQMELLTQLGRPGEAMTTYDDYQRRLKEEMDAAPSPDLQVFRRRLLGSVHESS
ncbi:MAG: response regulator [Deltaproteobacteria bacterium]|nr:response regulator [Deltaproteobacteria bacterium]